MNIKTALTYFSAVTPSSGSALFLLALASMNNALPDDGVTAPKHVRAFNICGSVHHALYW